MIGFKGSYYPKDVVLHALFFYVRYAVSYRDLEEIMAERRVFVDHALNSPEFRGHPRFIISADFRIQLATAASLAAMGTHDISSAKIGDIVSWRVNYSDASGHATIYTGDVNIKGDPRGNNEWGSIGSGESSVNYRDSTYLRNSIHGHYLPNNAKVLGTSEMKFASIVILFIVSISYNVYCFMGKRIPDRWAPDELVGLTAEQAIMILGVPNDMDLGVKGFMVWVDQRSKKILDIRFKEVSSTSNMGDGVKRSNIDLSKIEVSSVSIRDMPRHTTAEKTSLRENSSIRGILRAFNH